jgi:D-3-phosphoglycerate dehydrogenase
LKEAPNGTSRSRIRRTVGNRRPDLPRSWRRSRFPAAARQGQGQAAEIIGNYDGLAIRSATKATEKLIAAATNLKVIGRAGIGVDNVDIPAASRRGIIVMNTPFGNSITTAEHAIALMFAVARQLPEADASTQAGKWEKNRSWVSRSPARRSASSAAAISARSSARAAIGLKMHVSPSTRSCRKSAPRRWASTKVELDELLARADFITLHADDRQDARHHRRRNLAKTKPGVRIINCARGGLLTRRTLPQHQVRPGGRCRLRRVRSRTRQGEPAVRPAERRLHAASRRSTSEAQENVALQVAEQMADYLVKGAVSNAINMPSITAEEAPILKPFIKLAEVLGAFVGQVTEEPIKEIEILL